MPMKPLFNKAPLQIRFLLAVMLAITAIIVDNRSNVLSNIRTYIDVAVSPFYLLANIPCKILDHVSQILTTRTQLMLEIHALRQELLMKNSEQLILDQYKYENAQLRKLLNAPLRQDEQKMVTQVISTNIDLYNNQVTIDKGIDSGVYIGQPAISDKGVVGQVIATSKLTSRVLLICDSLHALPIQVLRNNTRMILAGNGCSKDLQLEHVPSNTDVRIGDILVTSGLGGRFPAGYPVAVVSSMKADKYNSHILIQARPNTSMQHLRYLLLLWTANQCSETPLPPNEIHQVS